MTDDLISRAEAIEAFDGTKVGEKNCTEYDSGYNDGIDFALSTLSVLPSAQQWIPCSERLPDDDRTKVVTLANGNAEAGYYSNGDWWCVGDSINLENPKVIAWMPLPKPYEVDK